MPAIIPEIIGAEIMDAAIGITVNVFRSMANFERLTVVLVRTRNPLNIGAVARAMQNFGARELRLVTPYEASFREARSAVGAGAVLGEAREFASVAEAVADCRLVVGTTAARRRELEQPLVGLEQAEAPVRAALTEGRVALLFGSEKHGLRREDLEHCHWLVRIATEEAQPSMNLGQAAAVCLWSWRARRRRCSRAARRGLFRPSWSGWARC